MKVALVHDWLVTYRGGEKVLAALLPLLPNAPIHTLFYDEKAMPTEITRRDVRPHPFLRHVTRARKALLPLLPRAIESIDLREFDLVVSTSSCVAKGAITRRDAKHICYIHSPMRYVWDQQEAYLGPWLKRPVSRELLQWQTGKLRRWDVTTANRVDQYVVNSHFVGQRVRSYYARSSIVVPPPVDVTRFRNGGTKVKGDFYLAAGALVAYKRFDLAIAAAKSMNVSLIIAGDGPELESLQKLARGAAKITFVRQPSDAVMTDLMTAAKGLLFPGVEDFGIIGVEALAAGTPVIAYGRGGALDYVQDGLTGVLFAEANAASLASAMKRAGDISFAAGKLQAFAEQFSTEQFQQKMQVILDPYLKGTR